MIYKHRNTKIKNFGARYYWPEVSVWLSVDPMASGRPGITPYHYCQNNPLNRVDPNGMWDDDYTINKKGEVKLVRKTDDNFDMLYTKESWDNGKKDNSIKIEKGTVERMKNINSSYQGNPVVLSYAQIKGEGNAQQLFEFVSTNTEVEYSLFKFGSGESQTNLLSTSHQWGIELAGSELINKNAFKAYGFNAELRGHDHNHYKGNWFPSGSTWPVGSPDRKAGDVFVAARLEQLYPRSSIDFRIFDVKSRSYTNYNSNSYFPLSLPGFEIISTKN